MLQPIDFCFAPSTRGIVGDYDPYHCWFYKYNPPLPVEEIVISENQKKEGFYTFKLTKDRNKNLARLYKELAKTKAELATNIEHYNDLRRCAPTTYGKPYNTNEEYLSLMADKERNGWEMSASLTHNHISYGKGLIIYLEHLIKTFI